MLVNYKHLIRYKEIILFFSKIYNFFNISKKNQIRVLIYHHVKKNQYNLFYKQLCLLKNEWNFITPKQFENHIKGTHVLKGKNTLLTFDDGFIPIF